MLDILKELQLALAEQGIPPEAITKVGEFLADLHAMIRTAADRNAAQAVAAKVGAARALKEMQAIEMKMTPAGANAGVGLGELAARILGDLMQDQEDVDSEPEAEPPEETPPAAA